MRTEDLWFINIQVRDMFEMIIIDLIQGEEIHIISTMSISATLYGYIVTIFTELEKEFTSSQQSSGILD